MPIAASFASWPATVGVGVVGHEHDVGARWPGAGRRPRPSRGSASAASQITPSRSTATAGGQHGAECGSRAGLAAPTRRPRRWRRCPASSRSPASATTPRSTSAVVTSPPYDVIDGDRAGRSGRVAPGQRRPRRLPGRRPRLRRRDRRPRAAPAPTATPRRRHLRALAGRRHPRHRRRPAFTSTGWPSPTRPAGPAPPPASSAPSRSSGPARAASSPTSAPRPRPRPTGSTCCGPPRPTSRRSGGCRWPPGSPSCSTAPGDPLGDCTDDDGVRHQALARRRPRRACAAIADAVGAAPVVIADGHHRYETSLAYRDERRAADGAGPRDATLCLRRRAGRGAAHRAAHPPAPRRPARRLRPRGRAAPCVRGRPSRPVRRRSTRRSLEPARSAS